MRDMRKFFVPFCVSILLLIAGLWVGYSIGRHAEAEAREHPTGLPVIGVDGAGHLVSSLHWTDDSDGILKHYFSSGKYTLNVWKARHCTEEEWP